MPSPQLENGYLSIANEIIEKLARYRISGQEYQVLWVILRKTWGWHKKEDHISITQIEKMTEMKRSQVCRSLSKLVSKKILCSPQKDTTNINIYRFNKDYEQWIDSPRIVTGSPQKDTGVVPKEGTKVVPKEVHTKETKETNTKDNTMAFEKFWSIYPNKKKKKETEKIWKTLSLEVIDKIMNDIPNRIIGEDWLKDNGKFIPHPTTYLRGERWTDEIKKQTIKINSITI